MSKQLVLTSLLLGISQSALAHTGMGTTHGFMAGFVHPWQGVDHLLVMFVIGLWGCVLGGRALWILPLSFLMLMAAGAGLSFVGISLPFAELWVASSVVVFGLIIGFNTRLSEHWATGLVMVFALFHGYVHAEEITSGTAHLPYVLGFLVATALLHLLGIGAGLFSTKPVRILMISFGWACATVGCFLLAGY
ncbi:HupE/UreJ family protein [Crenothrix polyspora]|uniref:Protein HupE n=1 Tax=Crenothrix polyspora TaxID=360316 RepID=A0A1R4HKF5_9GAMM|nr:HupE/UreJ family protein [Crenothrix polyspora]SJM96521.1 Protein HupE [Crenothrix polyspora]